MSKALDRIQYFATDLLNRMIEPSDYCVVIPPSQEAEFLAAVMPPDGSGVFNHLLDLTSGIAAYGHVKATDLVFCHKDDFTRVFGGLALTSFQADVLSGSMELSARGAEAYHPELTIASHT